MILDTTFLVDLMKGEEAAVARARRIEREATPVRIPAPALFELWRGVHLASRTAEEEGKVVRLLSLYPSAAFDADAAARGGEVDALLLRRGAPLDPEDAMIAGIALARTEPLLTRNVRHFSRVPGLRVESY